MSRPLADLLAAMPEPEAADLLAELTADTEPDEETP